jgi:hypothetical protein
MPRIVHFEIPADDPAKLQKFYGDVFGWQFQKWDGPMPYWLITTGPEGTPGINGGMMPKNPGQPIVNTIDVPSVDEYAKKVEAHGGTIVVPKMAIPGVGWLAYFKDPEGNITGIYTHDPGAK